MKSRLRLGMVTEHAASMKPDAVTAMIRLMIPPPGRLGAASPRNTAIERCRVTWRLRALALVSALKYLRVWRG
jgi:hypothetical protein